MSDKQYKSLVIVNESKDASITLYIYAWWDFICWLSLSSKIIHPGQKHLCRSEDSFKFKLVAKFKDKSKQTMLEPKTWVADRLFNFTKKLCLIESELKDSSFEKQVCLHKVQRDKELNTTSGKRNLYAILGLDIDKIRKMPREKQIEAIKEGYREEIKKNHPDKKFCEDDIAKEINMARDVLLNNEMRARYHNEADYEKGWLSPSRWKAVFNPEQFTERQQEAYKNRMWMTFLSASCVLGGVALTAASVAAPAIALAGGVVGAGLQSLQHTVDKNSILAEECYYTSWLCKAGIGCVSGLVTGSAALAITEATVGLGSSAMESTAVTMGQYIGIGVKTGAVSGFVSSLASDARRKFVDGKEVTWQQAIGHAVLGASVGAGTGIVGGAVSKVLVGDQSSAATANLETVAGEQIATQTATRGAASKLCEYFPEALAKFGTETELLRDVPRTMAVAGTESVMESAAQFVEERFDDSVENQSPQKHLARGTIEFFTTALKAGAQNTCTALLSHAKDEFEVSKRAERYRREKLLACFEEKNGNQVKCEKITDKKAFSKLKEKSIRKAREKVLEEKNDHLVKYKKVTCSVTYQPLEPEELLEDEKKQKTL